MTAVVFNPCTAISNVTISSCCGNVYPPQPPPPSPPQPPDPQPLAHGIYIDKLLILHKNST